MPIHNYRLPQGRVEHLTVQSSVLVDNCVGEHLERTVAVYLPPGYDESDAAYPLFVDLAGFTGSGLSHLGWKAFGESLPQRLDRLLDSGAMGPVILALPDCFTRLGGNQYVNSAVLGRWADFLIDEMVPALMADYRILPGSRHRALFGKSSGGYGALAHAMLHGEAWGAVACHSGDMAFELCYLNEFPRTLMTLARYDNDIARFVEHVQDTRKMAGGDFHHLMMLAMAATYDPDPDAPWGIRLPVTLDTCEVIAERWQNWLQWDPLVMIERDDVQSRLMSLAGIYVDCGSRDQYNLVFGARRLAARLGQLGIEHVYHEFDDNHSGVDYRMDESLPWLFERVSHLLS